MPETKESTKGEDNIAHPHQGKKAALFTRSYCAILAANFLLYFGFWLLIPILPFYLKEIFQCKEGVIGVILCCYTVSALCVRPFSGYLLDSFARKPLYLFAYFIFTSMFVGYLLAGTLTMFIILRAVHGVAFGGVTVGGNTIVVDIMPSARRGEGLGYYGLTNNTAMSIGPMVGLFLHDSISFNGIFACGLGSCAAGLLLACTIKTPAKKPVKRPPVSLDRFILLKGIPASIALLLLSIPYGETTNYVAMYAKQIGINAPTGLFFTFLAVGMGVSRIFAGKYVDKGFVTQSISKGFYLVIAAFALLGCCKMLMGVDKTLCTAAFFLVPLLQGVGFGVMFPAYNTLYVSLAPHDQRATATSTYLTAWDVGIGIGISTGGLIAQFFGFHTVYFVGAALSLISMLYFNKVVTPHYWRNRIVEE